MLWAFSILPSFHLLHQGWGYWLGKRVREGAHGDVYESRRTLLGMQGPLKEPEPFLNSPCLSVLQLAPAAPPPPPASFQGFCPWR